MPSDPGGARALTCARMVTQARMLGWSRVLGCAGQAPGHPADRRERGSAVVDFVLVSLLVVALLLAVLQVAVYAHVRNVVTASAQEGARYAANADVASSAGAERTLQVVGRATSEQTARGLTCTSGQEADPTGLTLVVVRCTGAVPSLLAVLGDLLPLEATGRAIKEGT